MNTWVAAGATAVVVSERGRNAVRRGVVLGLATAMAVGRTVASAATEVAHGAERAASSAGGFAGDLVGEAQDARSGASKKRKRSEARGTRPDQAGRANR
jgi:hypothetical protein